MATSTDDVDLLCLDCFETTPHRWQPSPDAGPHWRCSECGTPHATGPNIDAGAVDEDPLSRAAELLGEVTIERDRLRRGLLEAIDGWEESAQYKPGNLSKKHGDAAAIARLRALYEETGDK